MGDNKQETLEQALRKARRLECLSLARVIFWVVMSLVIIPIIFFAFNSIWLKLSVFYLVEISHYANGATDFSSYQGARAERRSLENPPPES